MNKKFLTIQELCVIGLSTALICVIAPISIPMPLGIPLTLQTFILSLVSIILGPKQGTIATLIYMILGAFGLPVFSNFTGGWQVITGPTGGFILSFPLMAYFVGLGADKRPRFKGFSLLCVLTGNMLNLLCGAAMFCLLSKSTFVQGLTACVIPFLPITVIKMVLSWIIGLNIKRRIVD